MEGFKASIPLKGLGSFEKRISRNDDEKKKVMIMIMMKEENDGDCHLVGQR